MPRRIPKAAGYHWDSPGPVALPCGSRPCRLCKGPIPAGRRRTFCSGPCVLGWRLRTRPRLLRRAVFDRAGGVCASCGLDCRMLDLDWLRGQLWLSRDGPKARVPSCRTPRHLEGGRPVPAEEWLSRLDRAERWRFANKARTHAWEAHHLDPITLGGDWFDLGRLALLCLPCHRRETGALATRRARARKGEDGGEATIDR